MSNNRVEVVNNVQINFDNVVWFLHFQQCIYHLSEGDEKWTEEGYRFMWSKDGRLCGHRGQARIPDSKAMYTLITMATIAGWFETPPLVKLAVG